MTRGLPLSKLLTLGKPDSNQSHSNTQSRRNPKYRLPRLRRSADAQVGARCTHVAEGVALLKNSGHETSCVYGAVFEGLGRRSMLGRVGRGVSGEDRFGGNKMGRKGEVEGKGKVFTMAMAFP